MLSERKKLIVLHTNDIHSHLEQTPKIAAYMNEVRQKHDPSLVLTLDIGDHLDRMRPETEGTDGLANVQIMNATGYEAMVVGNNEGLTFTPDAIGAIFARHAGFSVIGSNITETNTGNYPSWMVPYRLIEKGGLTIGLLGVTATYPDFYDLLGWKVDNPIEAVANWTSELRSKADVLIVLSHTGILMDRMMAEQVDGIDLIFGGHTHHLLEEPERINGTMICAAGKFGQYVGEIHIEFDPRDHTITGMDAGVVEIEGLQDDPDILHLLTKSRKEAQLALGVEVARLSSPLKNDWYAASPLGNLLADSLRRFTRTELSLVNAGQLLGGLEAGSVTKGRLLEICPSPINPCRIKLRGKQIRKALEESLLDEFIRKPIRGFGFRGKVLGTLCMSGVEGEVNPNAPSGHKWTSIRVNGRPLQDDRVYSVGTIDMFTFGVGYLSLSQGEEVEYLLPDFLRDLLCEELILLNHSYPHS
ncbi:bifunctional UDP-sugar hydrolase/5'-nucleotidase [Paenibacillus larvae]